MRQSIMAGVCGTAKWLTGRGEEKERETETEKERDGEIEFQSRDKIHSSKTCSLVTHFLKPGSIT
jgi:hypothetical protein